MPRQLPPQLYAERRLTFTRQLSSLPPPIADAIRRRLRDAATPPLPTLIAIFRHDAISFDFH
jgi:hypothetical protein